MLPEDRLCPTVRPIRLISIPSWAEQSLKIVMSRYPIGKSAGYVNVNGQDQLIISQPRLCLSSLSNLRALEEARSPA